ncbi:glucodextranase DOMON-like domain-containing protein [Halapricum hydrolyticum]|uniref:PKD domain-containing protein n=1 Tax=Halapricum hydrolyticum TaxID=2979991 RepID=A0AAE3LGP2_9EURY|nr:glucodextranase DOMON-like domain-containing protein [Halapricum hydrolyticum]MCU4725864.1 PKD domain-containing protein [Halapricum hydrolyticum]
MRRRQYLSSVASIGAVSALGVQSVGADTGRLSSLAAQTDGTMTIGDREGDDYGPGTYTYPTNDQLPEGCFDVTGIEVEDTGDHWEFTNHMGTVPNSFGGDEGFSVQVFQLYIQDPNAPDDAPSTSEGREGVTSTFQEEYHYRVHVMTGQRVVEDAEGNVLAEGIPASGDTENNTISFSIPKEPFDSDSLDDLKMTMLVFSQDGFGVGGIRQSVGENAGEWAIGGANPDAVENAPKAMELVGPEDVVKQEESLAYSADSVPTVPLFDTKSLVTGEVSISLSPVAAPIGEVWGTLEGTLDGTNSSGPEGVELSYQWEQTSGPEAEIADPSAAEATFTAPDVDEETELEFTLTISDPDGNEASDTTTAMVIPQSANDAPTADAGENQTVDPGEMVSLQAVNSEDPNGGTLSYQWEQTSGPDIDLVGPDSIGAAFKAPEVEEDTDFVFELTVNDGQGKTATDSVTITVRGPEETETPTETETETEEDTGDGFGPGFGAVTGLVGAAGGAAYAAKRRLGGDEGEE